MSRLVGRRMRPDYEIHPDAETEFATWCQDDLGYIPEQEVRGGKLKFRSEADRLFFTFRWLGVPRSRN
jgi:hypothetical protein